jgi:hypothetical protein
MQLEYERQDELGEAQEQRIEKLRLKRQKCIAKQQYILLKQL